MARNTVDRTLADLQTQHQAILNSAGEGIYGLDADGNATFVNKAAAEILGWKPENVVGQSIHEFHHHSHADGTHYPRAELLGIKASTLSYRMKVLEVRRPTPT